MLAASALLLLVINPTMLMKVGFQLSYLAVSGIVLLFRPIYNLFISKNRLIDQVWQLTVVSLAATLITFPLSLFYFNQFPKLFLVTNLIAIPISFLIVYIGMLLLSCSFLPVISFFIGKILSFILSVLNYSVGFLEGLPFSTSHNLFLTFQEFLLLMSILISLVVFFLLKNKKFLFISISLMILICSSFTIRKYLNLTQTAMVVYSIRGHTAIEFIRGKKSVLVVDSVLLSMPGKIEYATAGNLLDRGITRTKTYTLSEKFFDEDWVKRKGGFFYFNDQYILFPSDFQSVYPSGDQFESDIILLAGRPSVNFLDIKENFSIKTVILDTSIPPWEIKKWRQEIEADDLEYHDISKQGAFVMKFN